MKIYAVKINGIEHTMQFPEGKAPKDAVEVKQASKPKNKGRKAAANKSEKGSDKAVDEATEPVKQEEKANESDSNPDAK